MIWEGVRKMPSFEGIKQALTFDSVLVAIAVILLVFGVIKAVVSGVEAWKKISLRDRVKDLEGRMAKVESRLQLGDKRFELQQDDMGHLLNTQMALMIHFVSGNDHDKLREQIEQLSRYMSQRATKAAAYAQEHEEHMNGGGNA